MLPGWHDVGGGGFLGAARRMRAAAAGIAAAALRELETELGVPGGWFEAEVRWHA